MLSESGRELTLAAVVGLAVTLALEPLVIQWVRGRSMFDIPVERSNHLLPTPRGGGVAVVAGIAAGVFVFGDPLSTSLMAGVGVAAVVGAVEDVRGLGIGQRLMGTTAAAIAMATALAWHLPAGTVLGTAVLIATVPWTLAVVNAVNFMDGINGISAATAVVSGAAYAWMGVAVGAPALAVLGVAAAAAGMGFAPFNVPRARVFLGDVGSYGLGAVLAATSLVAVAVGVPLEAAIAPLSLYLVDTGVTILNRMRTGEPWYLPHKTHVYQRLVALGHPHMVVSGLVAALIGACSALGAQSIGAAPTARAGVVAGLVAVLAIYLALPRLALARVAAG